MRAGDLLEVDFGIPLGSEPGFRRPAILITADAVLEAAPRVLHVVPVTSNTERRLPTEVPIPDGALALPSVAQCHLCTAISAQRVVDGPPLGHVGATTLAQVRAVLGDLLGIGP